MIDKYACRNFYFCGDNIACLYEYLDGLTSQFIAHHLDIEWMTLISMEKLDSKLINKMKRAGCDIALYGIESGSNRILKSINKDNTVKHAADTLRWTKQEGIKTVAYFIVGCPYEEDDDIYATIDFIKKNKDYIDFGVFRIFRMLHTNLISRNPLKYRTGNLRSLSTRYLFAYDEINGLFWNKKLCRVRKIFKLLRKELRACGIEDKFEL